MKEAFIDKRFNASSRGIIDHANLILAEHKAEGFTLTLRQLFYEFVNCDLLPNDERQYKRLGNILSDARMAGLMDWNAIEDRMRGLRRIVTYASPLEFMRQTLEGYAEDLWADQDTYCEVWIEKDALVGVIEPTCFLYRVPYYSCRGYASQVGLYEASRRFATRIEQGKRVVVLHLGDHDPSGIQMTQDNEARLREFLGNVGSAFKVARIAVNQEQISRLSLPHDPSSDEQSWELEALPCREINRLVVSSIADIIDASRFQAAEQREKQNRDRMQNLRGN